MTDPMHDPEERRREMARRAGQAVSTKMSDLWWTFLMRGVFALVLGLAALFCPTGSISLLLRLFGFFLILEGAMSLFGVRRRNGDITEGAAWIVSILLGALLLLLPSTSARLAFVVLGLWAGITGVGYLMSWQRMPVSDPERTITRNVGIIALIAGIMLIFWPGTGMVALGWMLAVLAFAVAALMFFLASRFKRLNERLAT